MKTQTSHSSWFVLLLIVIIIFAWGYAIKGFCHKCTEPPKKMFVEKFIELQEEAGCKRIDAEVGPEVKRLFNAKMKAELPEYFNKCAAPYFTASGAPRKE